MTKADIVASIADKTGLTKKEVASVVNQFFTEVKDSLIGHKHIEIRGFGTFKVVERKVIGLYAILFFLLLVIVIVVIIFVFYLREKYGGKWGNLYKKWRPAILKLEFHQCLLVDEI